MQTYVRTILTVQEGTMLKSRGRTSVRHKMCRKAWKEQTAVVRRKRMTLMPAISLAALSLMVTLPALSSVHLYAASAQRYATVTVQPGDTLWSIAASHTSANGDIQTSIDRISETNHLSASTLQPGQHLRIPQ